MARGDRRRPDAGPAAGQRGPERLRKAPFALVLDGMQGRSDGARERAHHSSWSSGAGTSPGSPIGHARRSISSRASRAGAHAVHSGWPSAPQPDAASRQRERRARRGRSSVAERGPGDRHRLDAHRWHRAAHATAHPMRDAVADLVSCSARSMPTGSSRTPWAPRTNGTRPGPGPEPRCTATTGRAPSGAGLSEEDRVDREAHEHHVDPVRIGQPQAGPVRERGPAHEAHELAPQRAGDLELRGEDRSTRVRLRAVVTARTR